MTNCIIPQWQILYWIIAWYDIDSNIMVMVMIWLYTLFKSCGNWSCCSNGGYKYYPLVNSLSNDHFQVPLSVFRKWERNFFMVISPTFNMNENMIFLREASHFTMLWNRGLKWTWKWPVDNRFQVFKILVECIQWIVIN